jgi:hypothetical protein
MTPLEAQYEGMLGLSRSRKRERAGKDHDVYKLSDGVMEQ